MYPGSHLGSYGRVWFFHEVPEELLIPSAGVFREHVRLLLPEVVGLLLHLVLDGLLAGVVLGLAAGLQVDLVDAPVVEIVTVT